MNKLILIELAKTWKSRADMVAAFPTDSAEASEVNKKVAEVMIALCNDLFNVIKLFETIDQGGSIKVQETDPDTD